MSSQAPPATFSEARRQIAARIREFRGLQARGALCSAVNEQFADEAASQFLEQALGAGEYLSEAVTLLTEIATLEEPCLSEPGRRATFPLLIETLSDSFDPAACLLYDRVLAQMVFLCRRLPRAVALDACLRRFRLSSERDLLRRKERLRAQRPWHDTAAHARVRKVMVLSRVTLGADVAITSVILQQAARLFPAAQRVLLGPAKAAELFGGDPGLRIRDIAYPPAATLLERLDAWGDVLTAVGEETAGLQATEYLLLDPDSRFLQLGMLPVLEDESRYFFFESRFAGSGTTKPLSQLASEWCSQTFPTAEAAAEVFHPCVWLRERDRERATPLLRSLHANPARIVVAVSFGVGGNESKCLPESFEYAAVAALLQQGCSVLLDKGAGGEEESRVNRTLARLRDAGYSVAEAGDGGEGGPLSTAGSLSAPQVLSWRGGIGVWAALMRGSDEYIGYDSAGQHIAAALGIPRVALFGRSTASVFRARWFPQGRGAAKVILADMANPTEESARNAVDELLSAHAEAQQIFQSRTAGRS